ILSWTISWITIVILSAPRRSTSGRAPWFNAIIRFWIRVESLKRPPTLLTIFSSFSSSSIARSSSTSDLFENQHELFNAVVKIVVDELVVVPVGLGELLSGGSQPPEDRGFRLGPPVPQPLFKGLERRRPDEHEQGG